MLRLCNVKKQYGSFGLDVSMEVKKGCVTGLIGQNGAGKSTTFKILLDLISYDEGEAEILSKKPGKLTNEEKEKLGVVLAEAGFSGYLTVKDVVSILGSMYKNFDKEGFVEKCNHFGLPMNKKIKEFSTGMKAKLKVLTAMSHGAKLLLLDEPTAGLDVVAREELLDLLRDYMEGDDCSILISSHISTDLEGLCDDVYMIHEGKIILHEETDVLLSEYGLLKVTKEQYETLDKKYLLAVRKESYGYDCLTNQKQFYLENYPALTMEKGSVDDVITVMIRGERV
ncbi:MAG: ABC transporter ATP-binding protein [Thermoflexaceae bacterium]|nr:ABC transporter ATP-binding protein [Thermoflexaceae bacterium]